MALSERSLPVDGRPAVGRTTIESALRDSEERHELLFQRAPGAMLVFDVETLEILAVNDVAVAQYGWEREDFLRLSMRDLRPEDWSAPFWRATAALRAGHDIHGVYRHRIRSGGLIDVELRTSTLPVGAGRLRLLLATDITATMQRTDAARFLDSATAILTSSLELSSLCRNLAAIAVPRLGEWCVVHRPDAAGRLVASGFAHANPLRQRLVAEVVEERPHAGVGHPAELAQRACRPVVRDGTDVAHDVLALASPDREGELARGLDIGAARYVPVIGRGGVLAVLECVDDRDHPHDDSTLALAMALAERTAIALDNAIVHQETRQALLAATQPAALSATTEETDLASWVFETIPDCFVRVDADWRIQYVNGEAERLLQRPREELLGGDCWTLFADVVGGEIEQECRRAMRDRVAIAFEGYSSSLDLWIEAHARPSGRGLAFFFRDATRQQRARQRMEDADLQYRDFMESATDLIHMIAPDGRILFANRAWRDTLGYSAEEVRTLGITDVVAPESQPLARQILEQCLLGRELPEQQLVVLAKDGRRVIVQGRANCRYVDGVPVSTRAIYRDVTMATEARELLAQAQRLEAAQLRAKTAFLDRMSHELRTPLTAVIGFAGILEANRGGQLGEREIDFARRIGVQGRTLLALVEDVLAYAEIESRRVDLETVPVELSGVVAEVALHYETLAASRGVTLSMESAPRVATIETDPAILRRILRYLVSDALTRDATARVDVTLQVDGAGRPECLVVRSELQEGAHDLASEPDPDAAQELGLSIAQSLARVLGFDVTLRRQDNHATLRTLLFRGAAPASDRAMDESAKTLHAVLDASPLPIIAIEPDWTVRLWNPAAEALFGWTAGEVIEHRLPLVRPEDDAAFRELLRRALDSPRGVPDAGFVHRHRDGRAIDVRVAIAALRAPDGRLRGFLKIVTDVTEQKRLGEELRQAQKMEVVGRLSGGIAHDFNNLLTVISAHSQFLLTDLPVGEQRADAAAIHEACERAAALTRQLLAFSRKEVLQRRLVDVNRKLVNTERMLRRILGSHIEFATVPSTEPPVVFADPAQIEQVLMNLVLNARDAMPRGGALVVETELQEQTTDDVARGVVPSAGRYAVITVSDTGVGMDAETRARIFEPFFTTKSKQGGTGLGLATVWAIVAECHGSIAVESVEGEGSVFRVRIPVAETAAMGDQPRLEGALVRGTETVLLVEDQESVRAVAARVLRAYGYTVLAARHGNDALEIVRHRGDDIHLLLTDLVMPELPGNELAARVREAAPHVRVLYMSGYSETPAGLSEADVVTPLVRKPFGGEELARAVRSTLDAAVHRD